MLDTAILLNVIPQRYARLSFDNQEDTLFAMARGYQGDKGDVTALPMKKWFTTNYHYLVPEIDSATDIKLNSTKPFDEFNEAKALGITTKPVLIGPYTFLKLARNPQAEELEYDKGLVNAVAAVYAEVVAKFAELGAEWIQIDEPYLVLDKEPGDVELFKSLYTKILPARDGKIKVLLNTYFGHIADVYETVNLLAFDGIGLDLNEGKDENLAAVEKFGVAESTTIFAGVVNGRNIWRNDYAVSLGLVDALKKVTDNVAVSTASSLLHVPFSTEGEDGLADDVRKHFAFAVEKLGELHDLAVLADASEEDKKASGALAANQALFDGTRVAADKNVAERLAALTDSDFVRQPARAERQKAQREALNLPLLPTTTIGSFPQTKEVRAERARLRKGEITKTEYDEYMKAQIDACIKHQEQIGLDVLVHGEFERNDMVEYFGQNLNGFLFTKNAWVQSYGTRCVKPPIVWGDVSRANPITVEWSAYAQSRTSHVMKGMLTGPVTILNWSWPREDITHEQQTQQLALAIRDEVLDLEAAGIKVIQIDEAALREKLPLRKTDWHKKYLDWAIPAFRLVHSAVKPTTQIHTHMCYSEFNDIITDIDAMDADVISFEASRGDLVVLDAIHDANFETEAGPGVYDIHSPRIPSEAEIEERIYEILKKMDVEKVWINPDCGLRPAATPKPGQASKTSWPQPGCACQADQIRRNVRNKTTAMHSPMFSLEVFPPKRTSPVGTIYDTLDGLQGLDPDFISVTYGTGKSSDRTLTARIAHTVSEYGIPSVAHLTAQYLNKDDVDQALDMFEQAKVSGVLALRGDRIDGAEPAGVFEHASDLAVYIRQQRPDMKIYGACYPEKHPQSATLEEDIDNLKKKVDAGVTHLISQLFYDNEDFLRFLDKARAAGIDAPIEAGIMPVMNAKSVLNMSSKCQSKIPEKLGIMLDKWGSDKALLKEAGIAYASEQICELVARGVDGVHLYTMNHPCVSRRIWSNVKPFFV